MQILSIIGRSYHALCYAQYRVTIQISTPRYREVSRFSGAAWYDSIIKERMRTSIPKLIDFDLTGFSTALKFNCGMPRSDFQFND